MKGREFVLDYCSVTLAWFFEDESSAAADAVGDALTSAAAIVPTLWLLEVGNALIIDERRKRTTIAKETTFLSLLKSFPIIIDDETATLAWTDTLGLARAHGLSVYDAAYLELALRRGLSLASLDDKLVAAAKTVGVPGFMP